MPAHLSMAERMRADFASDRPREELPPETDTGDRVARSRDTLLPAEFLANVGGIVVRRRGRRNRRRPHACAVSGEPSVGPRHRLTRCIPRYGKMIEFLAPGPFTASDHVGWHGSWEQYPEIPSERGT